MKIALDFDGTYTADPVLWDSFIDMAENRGHEVYMVTMRYPHEEIIYKKVIYTSRKAKKKYCEENDYSFNIWIDDTPEWLFMDSQ